MERARYLVPAGRGKAFVVDAPILETSWPSS